jgi:hypothetical protein
MLQRMFRDAIYFRMTIYDASPGCQNAWARGSAQSLAPAVHRRDMVSKAGENGNMSVDDEVVSVDEGNVDGKHVAL